MLVFKLDTNKDASSGSQDARHHLLQKRNRTKTHPEQQRTSSGMLPQRRSNHGGERMLTTTPTCFSAAIVGYRAVNISSMTRRTTIQRHKTRVSLSAVAPAQIIFDNRDPTGDKTNLISVKLHQLDSLFLASALFFSLLFARLNNKKTINRCVSLKESFAFYFLWQVFMGTAFHLFPNKQTKAENFAD